MAFCTRNSEQPLSNILKCTESGSIVRPLVNYFPYFLIPNTVVT